jgi:hypothetical protein
MASQRDPRVTDLRRYRRERERARRAQAAQPHSSAGNEPLLGRRKNAGLILAIVVAVIVAMTLLSHQF